MFCLTLVQCSSLLCLSWTILSTKMHLHMFLLLKMLCETMKFFHRLKLRKNVVSLLLPNDRWLAVPGSLLFAIPLCLRRNASCIIVHTGGWGGELTQAGISAFQILYKNLRNLFGVFKDLCR